MSRPPDHTLDQLVVLDAVARAGSFASAAKSLHRVPSAVSYAIRRLEESLGVSLFDRRGRRAELTAAGRRILEGARLVLSEARRLDQLALALGDAGLRRSPRRRARLRRHRRARRGGPQRPLRGRRGHRRRGAP